MLLGGGGPLELLPRSVLGVLLEFTDHRSVHQLEAASHHASALIHATGYWRTATLKCIALHVDEHDDPKCSADTNARWKRLACMSKIPCQRDRNLLLDVHACSSIDRPCESPSNTLIPSRCWLSMQSLSDRTMSLRPSRIPQDHPAAIQNLAEVAQIECGCETAACYWSSSPSPSKASRDFIEYTTRANCLVSKIQILPYRAFWHPDSPTFAPQSVSFVFYARGDRSCRFHANNKGTTSYDNQMDIDDGDYDMANDGSGGENAKVKIYESPVYAMLNDMQMHEFELPKQVWLAQGGTFRLNLIGRYQRETFEMPPWIPADEQEPAEPPYYCCLSYVNAVGVSYDYR
jgi:hypothetical protein